MGTPGPVHPIFLRGLFQWSNPLLSEVGDVEAEEDDSEEKEDDDREEKEEEGFLFFYSIIGIDTKDTYVRSR